MGRVNKYFTHVQPHLEEIKEWIVTMSEKQICQKLGVSVQAFQNYKNDFPELKEVMKTGRQDLVTELESALIKKAKGYDYVETKITTMQEKFSKEMEEELINLGITPEKVMSSRIHVTKTEKTTKHQTPDTGAIHLLLKNYKTVKKGADENWHNDDQEILDMKKKEIELKEKRTDAEVW